MRMNSENFSMHLFNDNLLAWMSVNEVNILSVSDNVVIFEYSVYIDGVRRWCKNMAPTAVTERSEPFVSNDQVKELNYTLKDIIEAVIEARKYADDVTESHLDKAQDKSDLFYDRED